MIGHFLLALTEAQEDRVLTTAMRPWPTTALFSEGPCLVQACRVHPVAVGCTWLSGLESWRGQGVGPRFDKLCHRFNTERVTAAIRSRILTNRLWRALQPVVGAVPLSEQELA